MGTNYYVHTRPCANACDHCAQATRVHLGKSSGGWKFTHRAYLIDDEDGWAPPPVTWPVTNRDSWLKLLDLGDIHDEYGRPWSRDDFLELIEAKQDSKLSHTVPGPHLGPFGALSRDFDADGYDFCPQEFS